MRRPWNLPDHPVYSLATYSDRLNMNICTYVIPLSRHPKLYGVSLEIGSFTEKAVLKTKRAILQLLTREHSPFIRTLGMKSGKDYDKQKFLYTKGLLTTWKDRKVLNGSAAYIDLELIDSIPSGDHNFCRFKVNSYKSLRDNSILMFHHLLDQKIILL